jgi:hypothetical protein
MLRVHTASDDMWQRLLQSCYYPDAAATLQLTVLQLPMLSLHFELAMARLVWSSVHAFLLRTYSTILIRLRVGGVGLH